MSLHTLLKPLTSKYPRLLLSAKLHTYTSTCHQAGDLHHTNGQSISERRWGDP